MRPRTLDQNESELLKTRVKISRETKKFYISDIVEKWGIGKMTVYRYDSDEYREKSQEDERKKRKNRKQETYTCYKCGIAWRKHKRCEICTMLNHGEECCGIIQ